MPSEMPTPMETICHGPLPLAGRLSCQSLRRNAVRGLVTSSAQLEGHPLQRGLLEPLDPGVPQTTVPAVFNSHSPQGFNHAG